MKKFIALILVSVILLMDGCSIGGTPNFSIRGKFSGTLYIAKSSFNVDSDIGKGNASIVINNEKNVFNTEYLFSGKSVKIKYDEIESKTDISELSKGNAALIVYEIYRTVSAKKSVKWKRVKSEKLWYFSGTYASGEFHGACDENGKIVSFSIPDLMVNYKIKKFG